MKTHKKLYQGLCSKENIALAFKKARKRRSKKPYVIEFEGKLKENLELLRSQLLDESYKPKPLRTFIIREPKTRKIRKSYFRDRVVHHAICNILEPIFDNGFIYDSFANRKGKGTLNAIKRFDKLKGKVSRNNTRNCYVLKVDIKHYFDEVDHTILIKILRKKIKDEQLISLILKVLKNHSEEIGMPLGNMTSQFFANVYLNELDQFVKKELQAKNYIRYVDDFVILHNNQKTLESYKEKIKIFLKEELKLELHKNKSKILMMKRGIPFLGFRNFEYHRLLTKANIRTMRKKIAQEDYEAICEYLEGWTAYAKQANTYKLRHKITDILESNFKGQIHTLQINRIVKLSKIKEIQI